MKNAATELPEREKGRRRTTHERTRDEVCGRQRPWTGYPVKRTKPNCLLYKYELRNAGGKNKKDTQLQKGGTLRKRRRMQARSRIRLGDWEVGKPTAFFFARSESLGKEKKQKKRRKRRRTIKKKTKLQKQQQTNKQK